MDRHDQAGGFTDRDRRVAPVDRRPPLLRHRGTAACPFGLARVSRGTREARAIDGGLLFGDNLDGTVVDDHLDMARKAVIDPAMKCLSHAA